TGALTFGSYSFIAVYNGDSNFQSSTGPIEPLTVAEARIQISPLTATNAVSTDANPNAGLHTLTAEVDVSTDGNTWTPVNGVTVNFSLLNNTANAFFVGPSSGVTGPPNANGQTSVTINSLDPGSVDINAATTSFSAPGVVGTFLSVATGTGLPNSPN